MDTEHWVKELPIGFKFLPTDEELVEFYLTKKVLDRPLPYQIIQEIDAFQLYSDHPKYLVDNVGGEREWYFFIHGQDKQEDGDIRCGKKRKNIIRKAGNGTGFWRSIGEEDPIYNSEGDVLAFKTYFTYFSGSLPNAKKTHWRMEEYRLPSHQSTTKQGCVLGKIKRGREFTSYL